MDSRLRGNDGRGAGMTGVEGEGLGRPCGGMWLACLLYFWWQWLLYPDCLEIS